MRQNLVAGLLVATLAAGCRQGVSPTEPTGGSSDLLSSRFTLTIDSLGSREAVVAMSPVKIDASGSTGADLTYRIDFGDGSTATQSVAQHVYTTPGNFNVTVAVVDRAGHTSTSSLPLIVTSAIGKWLFSGYVTTTRRVEVRQLTIHAQNGTSIEGSLSNGVVERTLTGTLSGERTVLLVSDNETLEGVLPSSLSDLSSRFELIAREGAAAGERLAFVPVRGAPSGPPPDANLNIDFFSFDAPFAVRGFSPILFDGSASRGDGLRSSIEFGDGEVSAEPSAVHPIARTGKYEARLTVVDTFGRSDRQTRTFEVHSLVTAGYYVRWEGPFGLYFDTQDGANVTGRIDISNGTTRQFCCRFTGALSGRNELRLVAVDADIVLTGTLSLKGKVSDWRLVLKQTGGKYDGQTHEFYYRNGY